MRLLYTRPDLFRRRHASRMLAEFGKGAPSAVTKDGAANGELTEAEVRERMSGNLCRCGAYVGIRDAIKQGREKQ